MGPVGDFLDRFPVVVFVDSSLIASEIEGAPCQHSFW